MSRRLIRYPTGWTLAVFADAAAAEAAAVDRRNAIEAMRRHGGHFINRFGAWATEEIAPWRGEPLPVGQLMQR